MTVFEKYEDKEVRAQIANYRRNKKTSDPFYFSLLEESSRRFGKGFDFEKTLVAVKQAAKEGRFLAYKELADRSGCEWSKVRYAIPKHLQALLEYCHARGLPLLSSIVVNKHNAKTGTLDEAALSGFVRGVEETGIRVDDPEAFLRAEQQKTFEWARSEESQD